MDDDGLSHPRAAEQSDLASLQVGLEKSMTLIPVSNILSSVD